MKYIRHNPDGSNAELTELQFIDEITLRFTDPNRVIAHLKRGGEAASGAFRYTLQLEEGFDTERPPLFIEIEYADEEAPPYVPGMREKIEAEISLHEQSRGGPDEATIAAIIEAHESKKDQILALYDAGLTDIASIVRRVAARPSYVAQVLAQTKGEYFDLYSTTNREQNVYSRFFRNVLAFKSIEAAEESIKKIGRLYDYFERLGDRAGQHQAMILALTGMNRSRWSGKIEESQVFKQWLDSH